MHFPYFCWVSREIFIEKNYLRKLSLPPRPQKNALGKLPLEKNEPLENCSHEIYSRKCSLGVLPVKNRFFKFF